MLPVLIKRIVAQYSDLRQYKKESLCKVEKLEKQQTAATSAATAAASHIKI